MQRAQQLLLKPVLREAHTQHQQVLLLMLQQVQLILQQVHRVLILSLTVSRVVHVAIRRQLQLQLLPYQLQQLHIVDLHIVLLEQQL